VLILVGLGLNVLGPLVNKGVFEHILFWWAAAAGHRKAQSWTSSSLGSGCSLVVAGKSSNSICFCFDSETVLTFSVFLQEETVKFILAKLVIYFRLALSSLGN